MSENAEGLVPPLREDPRDLRGEDWGAEKADEAVYPLGLHALRVPGLPDALDVGEVAVRFVEGPIRVQQTEIRQRHGLPVVFDKAMARPELGAGELIAMFTIREAPVPADFEAAFLRWQAKAHAAAGMVAAVLDERVAGAELFEDVVLLAGGAFVGAADMTGRVRTYLPFEVGAGDAAALEQLADLSMAETSRAARAARLYRRAALEGPTADGYAMLWVAAEAFTTARTPSPNELKQALREAGLNPEGMPVSVGRLIGLRGDIQHQGVEDHELLKPAFYEMEAIVRSLIRRDAGIRGGWWPASDNPAGFADPFKPMVAAYHDRGSTEWHSTLPPAQEPVSTRIPRQVPRPDLDPRLDLDPAFGMHSNLIAALVIDALEWQDAGISLKVTLGRPDPARADATRGSRAGEIWLDPSLLEGIEDPARPEQVGFLAWEMPLLVGTAIAQAAGIVSEGRGVIAVEAFGRYFQYQRAVALGDFDPDWVQPPEPTTPVALGKIAGWGAAGHEASRAAAATIEGEEGEMVRYMIESMPGTDLGPRAALALLANAPAPEDPDPDAGDTEGAL